jgi:hypothetical protein
LTAASGHFAEALLADMVAGNWQSAMTALHSPPLSEKELQEKAEKKAQLKSKRDADLKMKKAASEAAKDTDHGT